MCCHVRGYGRRRAWLTVVSPTRGTSFPYCALHVRLVRCWPACVWSVYGRVVVAAAVWLVLWCVSRLLGSLFIVGLLLLLPALSGPRLSCRRCVRSGILRAKVRVCAARYGESLWPCGPGFEVGRFGWFVGCRMVESRLCGGFVGTVPGGRGAACCRQPMRRRSRFDPCMPCRLGVGWLACGLFIVGSFFCSSFIGTRLCQPPYRRPVCHEVAECCSCCFLGLF